MLNQIRDLAREGFGIDDIMVKLKLGGNQQRAVVKQIVWKVHNE
jgi:hypothetical protein